MRPTSAAQSTAARPVAPKRPGVTAARAPGDAQAAFDTAYQAIMATRDPAKATTQLAAMKAAFDRLSQQGGQDKAALQEQLKAASERAAALPILYGVPTLPKPETLRNPAASTAGPSDSQAAQAKAWMQGYGAEAPSGFKALLYRLFPSLNKAVATPAFDQLGAAQQAQFLAVAKKADAAGQVALHELLVSGRLSAGLLNELKGLATDSLERGVDRGELLSQALVELGDPVSISQQGRGTCAATSVQILTAMEAPEQYVRLLRGLASSKGEAKLADGEIIRRESDWDANNDGGRSLPSRLLQPAFMEFANGELDYLNTEDMDRDPQSGEQAASGLSAEQALTLLEASQLSKTGFEVKGVFYGAELSETATNGLDATIESARDMLMVLQNGKAIDSKSQDELVEELKRQASPETPVYATVIYTLYPEAGRVGFHAVLVTEVKDGTVSYINPWGQEERLSEAAFKTSILSADVRK